MNGWLELLKCLLTGGLNEEGAEYADFAYEQTDQKPIFLFYKSMFLLESGKIKEGIQYLENGMNANPKLIKKFIELNPSILQHQQVVEVIARHKKRNKFK